MPLILYFFKPRIIITIILLSVCVFKVFTYFLHTHHVVTAAGAFEAESHVALVVDGRRVGELVRQEADGCRRLRVAVLQRAQDVEIHRTPGTERRSVRFMHLFIVHMFIREAKF